MTVAIRTSTDSRARLALFVLAALGIAMTSSAQTTKLATAFSISPSSVTGGTAATGTIRLPVVTSPVTVRLTSDNPAAQVSASVTITPPSLSARVAVSTSPVAIPTTVRISASAGGFESSDTITIVPPVLASLTLSAAQAAGGANVTGTVRLNGSVAAGQSLRVPITQSFASSVNVPQQVVVSGGQSAATFTISTSPVLEPESGSVSAGEGSTVKTASLTINPPVIESVTVSSFNGPVIVGNSSLSGPRVDVRLSSEAPGGLVIALSSNSPVVSGRTASLNTGARSVTIGPVSQAVAVETPVTITVTAGSSSRSADFIVSPPSATSLSCPTRTVTGSATITNCRLTLNGNAPAGGISIPLSVSGPGSTPSSVTVATGTHSEPFAITTTAVPAATPLTVTSNSKVLGTFSVTAPAVANIALSSQTVSGGTEVVASVTLNGDAPQGDFTVPLQSGNVFAATLPASLAIPAGKTTGSFRITTNPVQTDTTVTITAGSSGASRTVPLVIRAAS